MKLLRRNLTWFEYLPYDGAGSDLNDDGEHTGEFHSSYGRPQRMRGNISSPSGQTTHTFYGEDIRYTHTLIPWDAKADITEHGIVRWQGHCYEVTAVRPSLNVLSVALRRMTDDEGLPYVPDPEPDGGEG